jgi:glycosyltransferase involved in cell wall biosynthesis
VEGLKAVNGKHLFYKDTAEDYVAAISVLLTNIELWHIFRDNSRALAQQYYTWDYVLENIKIAIEK